MTTHSPELGRRKNYALNAKTSHGCDIHTDDSQERNQEAWIERAVAEMYKEYTQLEDMKLMGALDPNILTILQNKGALQAINLRKEKQAEN